MFLIILVSASVVDILSVQRCKVLIMWTEDVFIQPCAQHIAVYNSVTLFHALRGSFLPVVCCCVKQQCPSASHSNQGFLSELLSVISALHCVMSECRLTAYSTRRIRVSLTHLWPIYSSVLPAACLTRCTLLPNLRFCIRCQCFPPALFRPGCYADSSLA